MPPFVSKLKRTYYNVVDLEKHDSQHSNPFDPYPNHGNEVCVQVSQEQANTIASLQEGTANLHAPVIDIDWHCELRDFEGTTKVLDIWCDWPIDLLNVSNDQLVSTADITKYCKALESLEPIQAVFFSGRDSVIRYRFEFTEGIEAVLLPSKTFEHFHLYIETVLSWKDYQDLLNLLNKMGIVQNGFFGMTVTRGMSHLRKPSPELFVIEP